MTDSLYERYMTHAGADRFYGWDKPKTDPKPVEESVDGGILEVSVASDAFDVAHDLTHLTEAEERALYQQRLLQAEQESKERQARRTSIPVPLATGGCCENCGCRGKLSPEPDFRDTDP